MTRPKLLAALALLLVHGALAAQQASTPPATPARIACVGGALTEIVFALGAGECVVGVDSGSTFPAEAHRAAQLGYQRSLAAEGMLALRPDLVLAGPDAGPPAVLQQVRDAGVRVEVISAESTPEGAEARIAAVASALHRPAQGEALVTSLRRDVAHARELLAAAPAAAPPRVLCLYARARGALHVCGADTPIDAMVRLAGGVNAVDGLSGARPLGAEAAIAAAPDVILLPRSSVETCGGTAALLADDNLQLTPAGRAGRVIVMDDLLLTGFGPRTGQALAELVVALRAPAAPSAEPASSGSGGEAAAR